MLRIFTAVKIQRLRPGFNPRPWEIRTHNLSRRAAEDLRLRPRPAVIRCYFSENEDVARLLKTVSAHDECERVNKRKGKLISNILAFLEFPILASCFAGFYLSANAFIFSKRYASLLMPNLPSCYFTFCNCFPVCIIHVQTLQHSCVGFAAPSVSRQICKRNLFRD
jgi:hypothetical protein